MNRAKLQKMIIDDIAATGSECPTFLEIPTGSGKTKIALDAARRIHAEDKTSVLISTSNNYLVVEYLAEAKKFGISKPKIVIGKNNYVDKEVLLSEDFIMEYGLLREEVEAWLKRHKDNALVALFVEDFELPQEAEELIGADESDERTIKSVVDTIITEPGIYITNHYYLLTLLRHADIEDFFKVPVIADEGHQLYGTAAAMHRKSFSPYRIFFLVKHLMYSNNVPKTYKKALKDVADEAEALLNIARKMAFEHTKQPAGKENAMMDLLNTFVNNTKDQIKTIAKLAKKNQTATKVLNEIYEAQAAMKASKKTIVTFSPVKGNPVYTIPSENPSFVLRDLFCKHTGRFVAISGTFRVDTDPSIKKNEWSFKRLGFFKYKNVDTNEKIDFNERVMRLKFKVYPRLFKREQARYYIANERRFLPVTFKESNQKTRILYEKWIDNLASLAEETLWKNSLILMSSYENIGMMYDRLKSGPLAKEYEIFANLIGVNMRKLVHEYKEVIDDGKKAILIGGLNYYTGINLHGDYLNTLFIGKLPIEPRIGYYTKDRIAGDFSIQEDMRKNALLTFRQGTGRAIRSPEDRAFIVIADPRVENARYKIFKQFLDEYGMPIGGFSNQESEKAETTAIS